MRAFIIICWLAFVGVHTTGLAHAMEHRCDDHQIVHIEHYLSQSHKDKDNEKDDVECQLCVVAKQLNEDDVTPLERGLITAPLSNTQAVTFEATALLVPTVNIRPRGRAPPLMAIYL